MDATGAGSRTARPTTVLVAAIICFLQAAVFVINMLVGAGIAVLGVEGRGLHGGSSLLLAAGLLIVAFCLAAGILYLLGGRGLLRGRRRWYRGVQVIFVLSVAGGLGAYFAQSGNAWDLTLPVGSTVGLVLLALPRSRAFFHPHVASRTSPLRPE